MSNEITETLTGGLEPQQLRRQLQEKQTKTLRRRRAIIGLSLLGMGAMTAVSLFQTGVIGHLPDPPIDSFDSDKVNSSDTAYALGVPDGTLSLASLAANIPIAAFGGENRAQEQPIVPVLAAGKALVEAVVAGWYFYQMPVVEKKWCGYCITGALCNMGIAALSLPEAVEALEALKDRQ
ncbi:MAG TPA: vitamin K epoxide reductase family protein [Pyrinomonadaceae bacterium]|nr:vitamin K epoxide reductase family protein [Pyrinomonadaceae bacterium]